MVIKLYISGISGNKEVKKKQQRVQMILDSKQISYEAIDITEPGKEKDKEFMQQNGKVRESLGKYPLPPQIFNGDDFCGDYEDFDLANEVDELEKFLHIATNSQNVETDSKVNGLKEQNINVNNSKEEFIQGKEHTENEVNGEAEAIPTSESSNKIVDDDPKILREDFPTVEKEKNFSAEEDFVDDASNEKNEDDNKNEETEESRKHEESNETETKEFQKTDLAQFEMPEKSSDKNDSPGMEEEEKPVKETLNKGGEDENENDEDKSNEILNSEKAQDEN